NVISFISLDDMAPSPNGVCIVERVALLFSFQHKNLVFVPKDRAVNWLQVICILFGIGARDESLFFLDGVSEASDDLGIRKQPTLGQRCPESTDRHDADGFIQEL